MASIWNKILGVADPEPTMQRNGKTISNESERYAFLDIEVGMKDHKIHDIGAIKDDGSKFHNSSKEGLKQFIQDVGFICGHNIYHHDVKFLFGDTFVNWHIVDTLYLSPLLFPGRPYHKLVKDDKLQCDQMNNPVNDCEKARDLLMDEVSTWKQLSPGKQQIFATLLCNQPEFVGFLRMVKAKPLKGNLPFLILSEYSEKICNNADLATLIKESPCELAYALALVDTTDYRSVTPGWVLRTYPRVEYVVRMLRHNRCLQGCPYCNSQLDLHNNLKTFFGFSQFRTYEGEPLQENAARAAVEGKSLLAIFPTGGGKSLTFQLPALMEGRSVHGLTVVISPLQSLMKDQVDNLAEKGITDAVTINGLLDPITRALSIQRVQKGDASLLYIAPEMLRSKTIEKILLSRNVVRFVIDEAHCFSSWGQDFRVDYLYIGKFIKKYQEKKHSINPVPVSCFTATAKQKVIQDITDYFRQSLGINLELFASSASRTNLRYEVIHSDTDEDKYIKLRSLITDSNCPTIIYVSRTKRTLDLAARLTKDGFKALPFNGRMDSDEKIANQEAFMSDEVRIIVATSAFGMGVDKSDVGLVIHYDISDSLENYVQEAGRAGRDPRLSAKCYVLYSDKDLDKHFILLNQTKLSISEIQQVWKAVKDLSKQKQRFFCSALELARQAGWDDSVADIETRVRTALSALEQSGYIERGNNVPHVFATGITVKNMEEARNKISQSLLFEKDEVENAVRIIKSLISQKHIAKAQDSEAESRVDYLADILGLTKKEVISSVERMRQEGILADTKDISAYVFDGDTQNKSQKVLDRFANLEQYILQHISDDGVRISYKQLNENAITDGITQTSEKDIRTLLYYLTIKSYIRKSEDPSHNIEMFRHADMEKTMSRFHRRISICRFVLKWVYVYHHERTEEETKNHMIQFSIVQLLNNYNNQESQLFQQQEKSTLEDVEEALLYLSRIGSIKLEGGFLVLYNAMDIRRIKENKYHYKIDDYKMLNEFYKQKIQQVHIVGQYANLMVRDYNAALLYVKDYFQMDYKKFIAKYFKGERAAEIERNISPEKYNQLFGQLSKRQLEIISDKESRCIVVAAGPGSGKTRVLVHKLASLLQLEDVKHEQLLMLTFSRAAATEFKERLMALMGNAAHYVEICTFHSYCFDLLGRIGNLEESDNVVAQAATMISQGEVEPSKIGKTVLVIDEAQDMSADEYALVKALKDNNEDMRIIAVGDDDQNIYEFRNSDSVYMQKLAEEEDSSFVEMTENYRSSQNVVKFANVFVQKIKSRLKSTPIISMSEEPGSVSMTWHRSAYMYQPLCEEIKNNKSKGTKCVLTQTNEEAAIMVALLRKNGINSRLIQSMDGFDFSNLAEMRYFLKYIDKRIEGTPVITEKIWNEAKSTLNTAYATSECLFYVQRCVESFERVNRVKYYTDFKEFVHESSLEDFNDFSGTDVIVSTIHKAKGREFDDVHMLVSSKMRNGSDEELRRLYVGITRAKKRLFIHTNTNNFRGCPFTFFYKCEEQFELPDDVIIPLSHRDVFLGFFKNIKRDVLMLRSGDELDYKDYKLIEKTSNKPVARLSQSMAKTIDEWKTRGYEVQSAVAKFIVAWRPKDAPVDEAYTAVLLSDLKLSVVDTTVDGDSLPCCNLDGDEQGRDICYGEA